MGCENDGPGCALEDAPEGTPDEEGMPVGRCPCDVDACVGEGVSGSADPSIGIVAIGGGGDSGGGGGGMEFAFLDDSAGGRVRGGGVEYVALDVLASCCGRTNDSMVCPFMAPPMPGSSGFGVLSFGASSLYVWIFAAWKNFELPNEPKALEPKAPPPKTP